MVMFMQNLSLLTPGESAIIEKISHTGIMYRRLMDLGFSNGAKVKCISQSPLGDPKAYLIRGAVIALRSEDSSKIIIEK